MSSGDFVAAGPHIALVASGEYGLSDELDCHVYLLRTQAGGVLLDTGTGLGIGRLAANLASAGVGIDHLDAAVLTHAHLDHAGGVAAVSERTGAPVYTTAYEAGLMSGGDETRLGLTAAKLSGTYPADLSFIPFSGACLVTDRQILEFDELQLEALVTPGHTPGSTVWHARWPDYSALFTGDTVFRGGSTSVLNVPGSDAHSLRGSVPRLVLRQFDGLFPGHGPFLVRRGHHDVALAAARLQASVIPNRAVPTYRVSSQLHALAEQLVADAHG